MSKESHVVQEDDLDFESNELNSTPKLSSPTHVCDTVEDVIEKVEVVLLNDPEVVENTEEGKISEETSVIDNPDVGLVEEKLVDLDLEATNEPDTELIDLQTDNLIVNSSPVHDSVEKLSVQADNHVKPDYSQKVITNETDSPKKLTGAKIQDLIQRFNNGEVSQQHTPQGSGYKSEYGVGKVGHIHQDKFQ